jgi:serine/threonine protein kinase
VPPDSTASSVDALRTRLADALGPAFTIERELTGGGMSRVFLARDHSLGREVVVKLLLPELAAGISVDRFRREISLASRLQHPNVVPVLSAGDAAGLPFFIMPFVRGESLRTVLQREGRLGVRQAVRIMRDIAAALDCAHTEGVVHRDIKPDNVLLSNGGAMVTDFGVAKALSSSRERQTSDDSTITTVGTSLGTPAYMAPEQAAADPEIDHRADLYALGITAYEMLAGRVPFAGPTLRAVITAHLSQQPPPLAAARADLPPRLVALIMRCLEKDPAARPRSAAAIVGELDELFEMGATAQLAALPPRNPGRRRALIPAVAALLLLAAGGALWQAGVLGDTPGRPQPVRLALVPFNNQGSPDDAYFVDGLSDAVGNHLARLAAIALVDRTAAPVERGASLKELGEQLNVEYVLTGTVRWDVASGRERRAQVLPSLVRVRDGITVWAPTPYVVTPTDVFAVQSDIATRVAEALDLVIAPRERQALSEQPTENAEAYDAYLRGLDHFRRARRDDRLDPTYTARAVEAFEQATRLDPRFALAYAKLAEASFWWASLDPGDEQRAREFNAAVARAVELDPTLPETRAARALQVEH